MKLRNKKTGEIVDLSEGFIKDTYNGEFIQIKPVAILNKECYLYGSLAELNEEWEDYKPKEPLIKDEEVRKAVYLWALSLGIVKCKCNKKINNGVEVIGFEFSKLASIPRIEFPIWCIHADLTDGRIYTITELCGDENEED